MDEAKISEALTTLQAAVTEKVREAAVSGDHAGTAQASQNYASVANLARLFGITLPERD